MKPKNVNVFNNNEAVSNAIGIMVLIAILMIISVGAFAFAQMGDSPEHNYETYNDKQSEASSSSEDVPGFVYASNSETVNKLASDNTSLQSYESENNITSSTVDSNKSIYVGIEEGNISKFSHTDVKYWTIDHESADNPIYSIKMASENNSSSFYATSNTTLKKYNASNGDDEKTLDSAPNNILTIDPLVDASGLYVGTASGTIEAINTDNDWSSSIHNNSIYEVETDSDNNIYSASQDETLAKTSPDGDELWNTSNFSDQVTSVGVDDSDNAYACSLDTKLKKFDSDGTEIWSISPTEEKLCHVAIGQESKYVYTQDKDGTITKISTSDGSKVWSHETDMEIDID